MSTIDYGWTPISKLKRSQLETAYLVAIETRDRALRRLAAVERALLVGGQSAEIRCNEAIKALAISLSVPSSEGEQE
jgi:Mg-chelatase subunit ChlI